MKRSVRTFLFLAAASAIAATATIASHHGHDDGHHHEQRQERQLKLNVRPSLQKWRTASSDCTIQVISYMQIPTEPPLSEDDDEEFVCELDPADAPGGYSGVTRTLGLTAEQKLLFKNMWAQDKLLPGTSKLMISQVISSTSSSLGVGGGQGVQVTATGGGGFKFNSQMIQIPPEVDIRNAVNWNERFEEQDTAVMDSQPTNNSITSPFTTTSLSSDTELNVEDQQQKQQQPPPTLSTNNLFQHRHLQSVSFGTRIGPTPILVVKVTDKNGLAPDELTAVISDDVFGTSGDSVTLKSRLYACSMGRLTVIPGDNNSGKINQSVYNAPGVVAVKLRLSIETSTDSDIRNAVTVEVQKELGVTLPGPYKHVMYVLQKCYGDCGWAAYAFVNGWNSVYVGNYYKHVGVQIHEIGHNFGLGHSGGLNGGDYSDHACSMGNPTYADDIGKMCFNGAKSWQIGWYNDRKAMLNPKTELARNANWGAMVTLVGIADYQNVANIPVVLKLETDTVNDYFIAFNRATGINSDNVEADNEVTVVLAGKNGDSTSLSYLKATLKVGEQYVLSNFGGGGRDCPIKLVSIDESTSVWKANVQVGSSTIPTPSPSTMSPTNKPTTPSTMSPTNKPTTPSTMSPTNKPTTKAPTANPTTKLPTPKPTKPKTKRQRRILSEPANLTA